MLPIGNVKELRDRYIAAKDSGPTLRGFKSVISYQNAPCRVGLDRGDIVPVAGSPLHFVLRHRYGPRNRRRDGSRARCGQGLSRCRGRGRCRSDDEHRGWLETLPLSPLAVTVYGPPPLHGIAGDDADAPWTRKDPDELAMAVTMSVSPPSLAPPIAVTVTSSPGWNPAPRTVNWFSGGAKQVMSDRKNPSWLRRMVGFLGLANSWATRA